MTIVLALAGAIFTLALASITSPVAPPPNVVLVVADDLGVGDLGCYGQTKIRTPHIDALAREGMRFTRFYAGAPVCAPSRCTLLTGLHTGHAAIRANKEILPEGQEPLPAGTRTLARLLKLADYRTVGIGKWGLGGPGSPGVPERQGFDAFFGFLCQRMAHDYYPPYLWRNGEKAALEANADGRRGVYAPDLFTAEALAFIRGAASDQPFFLYLPYTLPHLDLDVPTDSLAEYAGEFPETPYDGFTGYRPHPTPRAAYAAMVSRLDRDVGAIVSALRERGLDERTIVLFTSDNGPTHATCVDTAFFDSAAGLRGRKGSLYEGGIRAPLVLRWPGRIAPGTTSDALAAMWDLFPTIAELAGTSPPAGLDGVSLAPTLLGKPKSQRRHDHLVWEHHEGGGWQAVRLGDWKGVRRGVDDNRDAAIELYDLASDPAESTDVAARHPDVVARIREILRTDRTESAVFRFR